MEMLFYRRFNILLKIPLGPTNLLKSNEDMTFINSDIH